MDWLYKDRKDKSGFGFNYEIVRVNHEYDSNYDCYHVDLDKEDTEYLINEFINERNER